MSYCDLEEEIKEFFRHSISRTLDDYDFDTPFDFAIDVINQKLSEHGLGTEEEFIDFMEDINGRDHSDLSRYSMETNYIYVSADMIHDVIMRYLYEQNKRAFENLGSFVILKELVEKLENSGGLSTSEKAILFDEVIHAQHETGDIFDDIDIEEIKKEIDLEFSPDVELQEEIKTE